MSSARATTDRINSLSAKTEDLEGRWQQLSENNAELEAFVRSQVTNGIYNKDGVHLRSVAEELGHVRSLLQDLTRRHEQLSLRVETLQGDVHHLLEESTRELGAR